MVIFMLTLAGNIFDIRTTYPICIPVNGVVKHDGNLVMGAGLALEAVRVFPELPSVLGKMVLEQGNRTFYLKDLNIFSFPTKEHFKDKSSLNLIRKSAEETLEIMNAYDIGTVCVPKLGCGLGGLDWEREVRPVIKEILTDRVILCLEFNVKKNNS